MMQQFLSKLTAKSIATVALFLIAAYYLFQMLSGFLTPIIWAIALAIFISPLQRRLNSKLSSKNLAAFLGTAVAASVIIVPSIILLVELGTELVSFYRFTQKSETTDKIFQWFQGGRFSIWLQERLGITVDQLRENLAGNLQETANALLKYATSFISNSVKLFVNLFFIIFTLFFLLRDGDKFLDWTMSLLPMHQDQKHELIERIKEVINATLVGNFIVAATQGSLAGLMFYILGIPAAILWTMLMIVLSMIPFFGTFIIWMPAAVWLFATGHPIKGIVLIIWGVLVVGLIDNFMRPQIVGKQTNLHTLVIFYAVLGGVKVFGPLGFVLGPLVVACFSTLLSFISANNNRENPEVREE